MTAQTLNTQGYVTTTGNVLSAQLTKAQEEAKQERIATLKKKIAYAKIRKDNYSHLQIELDSLL